MVRIISLQCLSEEEVRVVRMSCGWKKFAAFNGLREGVSVWCFACVLCLNSKCWSCVLDHQGSRREALWRRFCVSPCGRSWHSDITLVPSIPRCLLLFLASSTSFQW